MKSVGARTKSFLRGLFSGSGVNFDICGHVFVVSVAVLCGASVPPPVLSYHSLMVLHFTSDSSVARRGFHAAVTFISHAGASAMFVKWELVKVPHTLKATTWKWKRRSWSLALFAMATTAFLR